MTIGGRPNGIGLSRWHNRLFHTEPAVRVVELCVCIDGMMWCGSALEEVCENDPISCILKYRVGNVGLGDTDGAGGLTPIRVI